MHGACFISPVQICGATSHATDETLYGFRLGDFVETSLERWNTFQRATFWDHLANRATDEISLIETPSRIFMRLTLPIMSMVITSFAPAKKFSSRVIHPGQF